MCTGREARNGALAESGNGDVDWRHWPGWSQLFKGDDNTVDSQKGKIICAGDYSCTESGSPGFPKGRLEWRSHAALQTRTNYACIVSGRFGQDQLWLLFSLLRVESFGRRETWLRGCPHHGGRSHRKPVSESRVQSVQPITTQAEVTGLGEGCVIFFRTAQRGRLLTWN